MSEDNGWRAIETAPRDGSHIVITSDSPLWRYPLVAFWDRAQGWWAFSEPCMSSCFAVSDLISHWLPLPAPPEPVA